MKLLFVLLLVQSLVTKVLAEDENPNKDRVEKPVPENNVVVKSISNEPSNAHTAFILRLGADNKLFIDLLKKKNDESWRAIRAQVINSEQQYKEDLSKLVSRAWLVCIFEEVIQGMPMEVWHPFQIIGNNVMTPHRGLVTLKELYPDSDINHQGTDKLSPPSDNTPLEIKPK